VATGLEFLGDRPLAWCGGEFATVGRAFVFQGGAYAFSDVAGCADLLTRPPTFTSLEPGPALVGIEVRGTPTVDAGGEGGVNVPDASSPDAAADAGPQAFCHQYYGDTIALLAGQVQTALVPLRNDAGAPVFDCEEGAVLCHDQIDNDLNGLVDCSDPRCAPVCVDSGVPSLDAGLNPPDSGAADASASDSGSE
jgi:hypothetical protein